MSSIRNRLRALEAAADVLPDPDAPIRIMCDPRFFGFNPRNPFNDMPAHECPFLASGRDCPICDEFLMTAQRVESSQIAQDAL